ncbi:MAG: hypothetical protein CL561_10330 [Alphaproteobacteria bacterium]|nr:hypothetical protein [Alphaproteobacteria bacterium]|tara:strand:+ start:328216 stop:329043 length:828 start_codon:yes stop_codon:yes gene_type:complete
MLNFGNKKIFKLIEKDNQEKLEAYIEKHPECLTMTTKSDENLLIGYAAACYYNLSLKTLLKYDAGLNTPNKWGYPPIATAINSRNLSGVKLLIEAGVDCHCVLESGSTLLHLAARYWDTELIELLIAQGLDPNAQDEDGNTPLHIAASYDRSNVAHTLLAHNADPTIRNKNGKFPQNRTRDKDIQIQIKEALSGKFIQEGDFLVSVSTFAQLANIDETALYNFQARTVSYQYNNTGKSLTKSFDEAISKTELQNATKFLDSKNGNLCGYTPTLIK